MASLVSSCTTWSAVAWVRSDCAFRSGDFIGNLGFSQALIPDDGCRVAAVAGPDSGLGSVGPALLEMPLRTADAANGFNR